MADRPTTSAIIMKIEETQKLMNELIKYYKNLEDILKGTPTRSYARNVRKYLERLKNDYLEDFKREMKRLRDKAKKAAKKREEEREKLLEKARKYREEAEKLRRV